MFEIEELKSSLQDEEFDYFVRLILQTYFDKADEDYLAARLLALHGMKFAFVWSASQCLEKYLKAALLVRGMPAYRDVDHDLRKLFKALKKCSDVDLPAMLEPPKNLATLPDQTSESGKTKPWPFREELTQFIARFSTIGGPKSRYNETDLFLDPYDYVKFDLVAKLIRECALDSPLLVIRRPYVKEETPGAKQPSNLWPYSRFGELRLSEDLDSFLRAHNYAYFPDEQSSPLPYSVSGKNNVGYQEFLSKTNRFQKAKEAFEKLTAKEPSREKA